VSARMIIRVHPDDRVDVRVEGLDEADRAKPQGKKLCDKVTKTLENDLGIVTERRYSGGEQEQAAELSADERLELGR
jgi:hypothetical protein